VAVPMRVASSEQRRDAEQRPSMDEQRLSMDEQDIASSVPPNSMQVNDLLGMASTPVDMPHPGRFEISTPDEPRSPGTTMPDGTGLIGSLPNPERPRGIPKEYTASYHGRALNVYEPARTGHNPQQRPHQRRFSFATRRRSVSSIAQHLYGDLDEDDMDGDLGYSAAEGQMGNHRKVIVERLELVKARNPVFTWC
jgi:phosphatidylinositol 4-kinase type 2